MQICIESFRYHKRKRGPAISAVFLRRLIRSSDPAIRYSAFWDWSPEQQWRVDALLVARHAMFHDSNRWVREQAAYVLSFCYPGSPDDNEWAPKALLGLYRKSGEHPRVRAQAAEGLANTMTMERRGKPLYRPAVDALLAGLNDPSPQVRFWSVFALWQIRAREALPELERLAATDQAMCPGWWTVAEEASDAIASLTNKAEEGVDRFTHYDSLTSEDICPYRPSP